MTSLRRLVATSALLLALAPATALAIPSFPGAEGFGAVATGGRGGKVLKVTSLAETGPGTLREALETPGPRIIVFDVSGVIDLGAPNASDPFDEGPGNNVLIIPHGDVTIAGQTAPGAGITLRGRLYAAYDEAVQNIIVRHLRIRPPASAGDGEQYDALRFSVNSRVMVDHVSVSWGVDESVDLYAATDVTVQWSSIEEAATAGHPEGQHNYGLLNDGGRISVHHNLFAHNRNRNPALGEGPAESRNNVAYNVRHGFIHHNEAAGKFNIVGNYFKQGPDNTLLPFYFDGAPFSNVGYHLLDNYVDDPGELVGVVNNPWENPGYFENLEASSSLYSATPFPFSGNGYVPVTTHGSQEAYALVLARAGGFPRDSVTARVVDEVEKRTGSWGAHYSANLMAGLTSEAPPADQDSDGMADSWESAHGLDPSNGDDHGKLMPSGYTAIEDYINGLADALTGETGAGGSGGAGGAGGAAGAAAGGAAGAAAGTAGAAGVAGAGGAAGSGGGAGGAAGTGGAGGAGGAPGGSGGQPAAGNGGSQSTAGTGGAGQAGAAQGGSAQGGNGQAGAGGQAGSGLSGNSGQPGGNSPGGGGQGGAFAGGAGGAAAGADEDDGCGCRVAGGPGGQAGSLLWVLALGAALARRRTAAEGLPAEGAA